MNALIPLLMIPTLTTKLDPRSTQGTWEGWGTSLCWMGKAFGDRDDVADLLFTAKQVKVGDETLPGLGLTIVRYNAGACSWNEVEGRNMIVGKGIQPFRQMEGFWLNPTKGAAGWDWSVDKNQRLMMAKAKRRGANRFELFSNSPMWWMCSNDNPSGAENAENDNLRPEQVDAFTNYLTEVAKHAKDRWGIHFTSIEPFNEPLSSWWHANGKQEGCHFSEQGQQKVLQSLARSLAQKSLDIPIAASDETFVSHGIRAWKSYGSEIQNAIAQVNIHGYQGEKSPRAEIRQVIGTKPLWVSEHGEADSSGRSMAMNIGLDFEHLKPVAWCYWQPLDGGGWGLLDSDVPSARIKRSNAKYFVMAQYSRHIRPGMEILTTGQSNVVAAWDRRSGKVAVVIANLESSAIEHTIQLRGFRGNRGRIQSWVSEFSGAAKYQPADSGTAKDGLISVKLRPLSVTTIEVK
jgi:galactan endo-1,6-beta-galactosidase